MIKQVSKTFNFCDGANKAKFFVIKLEKKTIKEGLHLKFKAKNWIANSNQLYLHHHNKFGKF